MEKYIDDVDYLSKTRSLLKLDNNLNIKNKQLIEDYCLRYGRVKVNRELSKILSIIRSKLDK